MNKIKLKITPVSKHGHVSVLSHPTLLAIRLWMAENDLRGETDGLWSDGLSYGPTRNRKQCPVSIQSFILNQL